MFHPIHLAARFRLPQTCVNLLSNLASDHPGNESANDEFQRVIKHRFLRGKQRSASAERRFPTNINCCT
jgi:hypothetical protein